MLAVLIRANAVDKAWAEEMIAGAVTLEQLENWEGGRLPRIEQYLLVRAYFDGRPFFDGD